MQSIYKYRFDRRTIYWTLVYLVVFILLGGLLYHLYEGGYLSAWFTSFRMMEERTMLSPAVPVQHTQY